MAFRIQQSFQASLLVAFAFVPLLAAAQTAGMYLEQAKEFAGMLGGASVQAAQAAIACENVRAGSEAGSTTVPKEAQGLFPVWRGGPDARWLREQSEIFGKGFTIVVNRLTAEHPESAEKLRSDVEQAMASGGPELLAEPEHAALQCAGLRGMVEMMGVLLTAVPRDGPPLGR